MQTGSNLAVFAALGGNTLIAVIKFVAAAISGSSAMFAEAVHSLADTGNQILILIGIKRSKKAADRAHPFGYGQEQYFWSFMVAILIFFIGALVSLYEGIHKLSDPQPIANPWLVYGILLVSMAIEATAFTIAYREFNKTKKAKQSLFSAMHKTKDMSIGVVLFEDSAALAGLTIALVGVGLAHLTGNSVFDAGASILIGILLALVAVWLAFETKELLIGESASEEHIAAIREVANARAEVDRVCEIHTMHFSPQTILVAMRVDFANDLKVGELERDIAELKAQIKEAVPLAQLVYIEPVVMKGNENGI